MAYVSSVKVYPTEITLLEGYGYGMTTHISAEPGTFPTVTWCSSNPSVATVDEMSGYVYAKSAGVATIVATATDGSGETGCSTITVQKRIPVTSITLNKTNVKIENNSCYSLIATISPTNANYKSVIWGSSDDSIVSVSNGNLCAKSVGTAVITVMSLDTGGLSASCIVEVTNDKLVKSVKVNESTKTMYVGRTEYFSATISPSNATNKVIEWKSSNEDVATVNPNSGLVTAKSIGSTTLYAMATDGSEVFGTCSLTVEEYVSVDSVDLCISLGIGECINIYPMIYPDNATNKNIDWSVDNKNILSIKKCGWICGKNVGKATVTATTADGSKTAKISVNVLKKPLLNCTYFCVNEDNCDSIKNEITKMPIEIRRMISSGFISASEIESTADGFFVCKQPLSYILNKAGIDILKVEYDGHKYYSNLYFDDWFLYWISNSSTIVYSLIKMREQEDDNGDYNDPGITVSFIEFDIRLLLNCLYVDYYKNRVSLYDEIDRVIRLKDQEYSPVLQRYFNNPASVAPYKIAEMYIQRIVDQANGNCINLPKQYMNIDKLSRVPSFIKEMNTVAGYEICDDKMIRICCKNCLSDCEKYIILATHTGNVSFNSFAAEVKYHAEALGKWYGEFSPVYERAVRADMAIGEENESGVTDQYYDLDSDIVQEQIRYHGKK